MIYVTKIKREGRGCVDGKIWGKLEHLVFNQNTYECEKKRETNNKRVNS